MATQVNSAEVGNDIIDLTTDDCSEVSLPKELVNQVDNDVNGTEVDVEFLGSCVRFVPVITISDTDILEDDNCKNTDTKPEKSHSYSTSQCSRAVPDFDILNNRCAFNDTRSRKLKASSTSPYEDLTDTPEGHRKMKTKPGSYEQTKSEEMKIVKTAGKALVSEKQSFAQTTVTNECYKQNHSSTNLKYSMQEQNIKNGIFTEVECSKNKTSKRKVRNEHDKNGSETQVKKPKIKVKIIMKKTVSGINRTKPRDTLIEKSVKTEKTGNHNVAVDNVSSATIGHGKYARKKEINDITNALMKQIQIIQSDSLHRMVNGECGDNKGLNKICKETSSNSLDENSSVCSQLAIYDAKLSAQTVENVRIGSDHNEQIQALASASTADEQKETPTTEVQLLPARMTITESGNQVVYAVPLLRLPVQRQIVYFSPEYIEIFVKKVKDVFSVKKFLHAIPDPLRYFRKEKNNENKYNDECLALMYLKSKYRKIPFPDIAFIFEKNKFSLALTCDELDVWTSSQRTTARKFGLGCGCPKPHELSMAFVHEVSIHEVWCC
jgi:hypothetical protein